MNQFLSAPGGWLLNRGGLLEAPSTRFLVHQYGTADRLHMPLYSWNSDPMREIIVLNAHCLIVCVCVCVCVRAWLWSISPMVLWEKLLFVFILATGCTARQVEPE